MNEEIIINQKFKDLIPPLSPDELANLHRSLDLDGCRDALLVWRKENILLDGHNRYEWCKKKGIEFQVKLLSFSSESTAEKFIMLNQISRRNLPPDVVSLFQGKMYNNRKKEPHDGGKGETRSEGHCDPHLSTADEIAKETGVSEKTVKRNAKFASAVETLGVEKEVINGTHDRSRKQTVKDAESSGSPTVKPTITKEPVKEKSPEEKVSEAFEKLSLARRLKIWPVLKRLNGYAQRRDRENQQRQQEKARKIHAIRDV